MVVIGSSFVTLEHIVGVPLFKYSLLEKRGIGQITNRVMKCDVIKLLFLHFSIFMTIFQ